MVLACSFSNHFVRICLYFLKSTKFGQLILRKIIEIVATKSHILGYIIHQIRFRPRWGSSERSPRPLSWIVGASFFWVHQGLQSLNPALIRTQNCAKFLWFSTRNPPGGASCVRSAPKTNSWLHLTIGDGREGYTLVACPTWRNAKLQDTPLVYYAVTYR